MDMIMFAFDSLHLMHHPIFIVWNFLCNTQIRYVDIIVCNATCNIHSSLIDHQYKSCVWHPSSGNQVHNFLHLHNWSIRNAQKGNWFWSPAKANFISALCSPCAGVLCDLDAWWGWSPDKWSLLRKLEEHLTLWDCVQCFALGAECLGCFRHFRHQVD